ncbi:MAG: type II toxin-antitoxin system HipA family toxin [Bacteroidetes bacterium]|nr:MAG: type II toxin-antitoxin system HipA family toxin [Bacteroidota bacterium]
MISKKTDIFVYANWAGTESPKKMGVLSAHQAKGRKTFSFKYEKNWLNSNEQIILDPDIGWYSGQQYPEGKENFGIFLDSMPDNWGRTLMKRRALQKAKELGIKPPTLHEIDYLLGVYDKSRLGGLRFKLDADGPFLDDNEDFPTPPWSSVRELQYAAYMLENKNDNAAIKKWLDIILAPGSSLGGARPKANVQDNNGHLWIAKFPSKNDDVDKAAWEFLAYNLAIKAGINMADSKFEKVAGHHHTFFTKRFDRDADRRIHFASAMTMTGNTEEKLRTKTASYLEIAEFIQFYGSDIESDLHQLWKRIVFNIAISNTDDHLRNHGFIIARKGWKLSPAFDINPSNDKAGLALNIDIENNALDFDLARNVGDYFQLNNEQMDKIIWQVTTTVSQWQKLARQIGISRSEIEIMEGAFNTGR